MKKIFLLSFLFLLLFSQQNYATPVAVVDVHPTSGKIEAQQKNKKRKKQKKQFLGRFTKRILKRKMGKLVKKMGLYPEVDSMKCDLLIKKNGDEMNVRIIEVGLEAIKFRKCDDENGPILSMNKKAIFMIKYADGEKEVFKNIESSREDGMVVQRVPMDDGMKTGGFGAGFLLGIFLGLLGVVIALVAFDGKKRKNAVKGALLGILTIFLLVLYLISLWTIN